MSPLSGLRPYLFSVAAALLLALPACDCNNGTTPPADAGPDSDGKPADATTEGGTPTTAHGILGRHSALAAASGTLFVSAYEVRFGDLVLVSASTGALTKVTKQVVDGVPTTANPPSPGAYRDGITAEGDDVGQDTDIVVDSSGEPMISYLDVTNRSVKLAARSAGTWTVHTVQQPAGAKEVVGRYTSLTLVDGKPALAYLALNIDGGGGVFNSELRWAEANKARPTAPGDWTITTVASGQMSCQNLCASDEACVVQQGGTSLCQKKGSGCSPQCSTGEACVNGACVAVLPDNKVVDIPTATGLWPSAVVAGSNPVVLFYDRVKGNLMAANRSSGAWTTSIVDGATTDNVGAFCFAVVDGAGTIHVAYQDASKHSLLYAQVDPATLSAKLKETIDDGVRPDGAHPVGADSALVVEPSGKVRVVYQDAQNADLLTAVRDGPNSWTPKTASDPDLGRLLKGGARGYGFYSDLVVEGGKVYGSTFYFDSNATPKGGLELFEVQ